MYINKVYYFISWIIARKLLNLVTYKDLQANPKYNTLIKNTWHRQDSSQMTQNNVLYIILHELLSKG